MALLGDSVKICMQELSNNSVHEVFVLFSVYLCSIKGPLMVTAAYFTMVSRLLQTLMKPLVLPPFQLIILVSKSNR